MWYSLLGLVLSMMSLLVVGCGAGGTQATPLVSPSPSPASTDSPTSTVVPTATPTIAPSSTAVPEPTPARLEPTQVPASEEIETEPEIRANAGDDDLIGTTPVTLTIIYDNNAYNPELRTAWGFACLVETRAATVLFDTGADGPTLLGNMDKLGIAPQEIDAVVLSHIHGDHVGGLADLLDTGISPRVYAPASFPRSFMESIDTRTPLVEVTDPVEVLPGIHTTGEVGKGIIEQALVVDAPAGLIVVSGCAHPGIVEMVRRAKETLPGDVALVMGGFHLGGADKGQVGQVIDGLRRLGVQRCAPCHCTGDQARRMFVDAFDADCILGGVGQIVVVGTGTVQVVE
jgi:7,8-dihydropterin-6-yl-methyl-4-(beta-D-ribofuranosyl)aminobenzene 5'-phosphate synthase